MGQQEFTLHACSLPGIAAVEADSARSFPRHMHDEFGIGVISRGGQISASGRGEVEAGPGDVITVNPGEIHDGRPIGDRGRAWRMLYFRPAEIADTAQDVTGAPVDRAELQWPVLQDRSLAAMTGQLFELTLRSSTDPIQREEITLGVFARLLLPARGGQGEAVMSQGLIKARQRIDDDPSAPLTLSDLAGIADLSRFQLVRGFSRLTGLPPHAYLKQRRVHLARRLIRSGMSLAEASYAAGFFDQSHMTRAFIGNYGFSPGVFARLAGRRR